MQGTEEQIRCACGCELRMSKRTFHALALGRKRPNGAMEETLQMLRETRHCACGCGAKIPGVIGPNTPLMLRGHRTRNGGPTAKTETMLAVRVAKRPMHVKEIYAKTNAPTVDIVRRSLYALEREGKVRRTSQGYYVPAGAK